MSHAHNFSSSSPHSHEERQEQKRYEQEQDDIRALRIKRRLLVSLGRYIRRHPAQKQVLYELKTIRGAVGGIWFRVVILSGKLRWVRKLDGTEQQVFLVEVYSDSWCASMKEVTRKLAVYSTRKRVRKDA